MSDRIKYGVDIDLANKAKREMKEIMTGGNARILHRDGAFSALYDISSMGFDGRENTEDDITNWQLGK